MSIEDFRAEARELLQMAIAEALTSADREQLLQRYTDEMALLHGRYAHQLLDEVIADAHTRLDARLSPDPIRQTVASVQTTIQDLWSTLWGAPPPPPKQDDR